MTDPTLGIADDAFTVFAAADERLAQSDIRLRDLERTARAFSRTMSQAFALSVTGARGFDDVLKGLYLRLSGLALQLAFKPVEHGLTSILSGLFGGLNGGSATQMQAQELWLAVRRLAPADQEVIYLRFFLELSEAELAATLGVAPGTVKSRLHRAVKRLRAVVEAHHPGLWEKLPV